MRPIEARHAVITVLLQAGEPLTAGQVAADAGLAVCEVWCALESLLDTRQVVCLGPSRGVAEVRYRWAARLADEVDEAAARARQRVAALVPPPAPLPLAPPDIESVAPAAFQEYLTTEYRPPPGKEWLVVLQCSVRRPFSSAPSHSAMRRAVWAATGCDPAHEFAWCPVHVVVLASFVGPVPYELEDTYPANVRAGGLKHMDEAAYCHARGVLAQRMAGYLAAHGGCYARIAAFADSRYGEVLADAGCLAGRPYPILPCRPGPFVVRQGRTRPRKYWERYWIQLYCEIERWLRPAQREAARHRLRSLDVEYEGG